MKCIVTRMAYQNELYDHPNGLVVMLIENVEKIRKQGNDITDSDRVYIETMGGGTAGYANIIKIEVFP